jgi:hypothetical protein
MSILKKSSGLKNSVQLPGAEHSVKSMTNTNNSTNNRQNLNAVVQKPKRSRWMKKKEKNKNLMALSLVKLALTVRQYTVCRVD